MSDFKPFLSVFIPFYLFTSILQFFNSSIFQSFNSSILQFFNPSILQFFNPSIFLLVFGGRNPEVFLEHGTEILGIVESCHGGHVGDLSSIAQQGSGSFQTDDADEVLWRLTRIGFQLDVEQRPAHSHLSTEAVNGEVAVRDILDDKTCGLTDEPVALL